MDRRKHWDGIYSSKPADKVSWFAQHLQLSRELIDRAGAGPGARVIDVGGGASTLVDDLLADGYTAVTILDISAAGLAQARARLGDAAARVAWVVADVTDAGLPPHGFDLWHDRAVFHFLTSMEDRARYAAAARRALAPGGHLVVGAFAVDGPAQCSGLDVARHSPATIGEALGEGFVLVESAGEAHKTPWDSVQSFVFCLFKRQE